VTGSAVPLAVRYQSFADLYEYCYSVAAIVGLVCIRIFGYQDPSAEPLAEHCGIAFQLTNIIRDVKEDAALGRVYLPEEDLERFGLSPAELLKDGLLSCDLVTRFRPVLEVETRRAREFYDAAEQLLPLIDEDSRPALWVLVTIYRRLLDKIAAKGYDVFGDKIRLSAGEKLRVLSKGLWMRIV
jgi:phytoene synthase